MIEYRIPLDEQAIMALQRIAGPRVHEAASLIQIYQSKCYLGDEAGSAEAKREMWKLAVKIQYECRARDPSLPTATDFVIAPDQDGAIGEQDRRAARKVREQAP